MERDERQEMGLSVSLSVSHRSACSPKATSCVFSQSFEVVDKRNLRLSEQLALSCFRACQVNLVQKLANVCTLPIHLFFSVTSESLML